jgi:hypothetical protein
VKLDEAMNDELQRILKEAAVLAWNLSGVYDPRIYFREFVPSYLKESFICT